MIEAFSFNSREGHTHPDGIPIHQQVYTGYGIGDVVRTSIEDIFDGDAAVVCKCFENGSSHKDITKSIGIPSNFIVCQAGGEGSISCSITDQGWI